MKSQSTRSLGLLSAAVLASLLVGCGGGGGSSTNTTTTGGGSAGTITGGSTACAAVSGSTSIATFGALLGSCEEYKASTSPIATVTAFADPLINSPVLFNSSNLQYTMELPGAGGRVDGFTLLSLAGGLTAFSLGNYAGTTQQRILDSNSGGAATIYDLASTKDTLGGPVLNLKSSRYGVFSRFTDRYVGYYGGWAVGVPSTALDSNVPAVATFKGTLVGVMGPQIGKVGTAVGVSASVTIVTNTTNGTVTSVSISNLGYSQNGSVSSSGVVPLADVKGVTVSNPNVSVSKTAWAFDFSSPDDGSKKGINGKFSANIFGTAANNTDLTGTIKFTTTDGRNGVAGVGLRLCVPTATDTCPLL